MVRFGGASLKRARFVRLLRLCTVVVLAVPALAHGEANKPDVAPKEDAKTTAQAEDPKNAAQWRSKRSGLETGNASTGLPNRNASASARQPIPLTLRQKSVQSAFQLHIGRIPS